MKVLITGADGFVGKNLQLRLRERKDVEVVTYTRADSVADLPARLDGVEVVFHLAGVNRPKDPQEFVAGNAELTQALSQALSQAIQNAGRRIRVLHTSSIQARMDNPYGLSKRQAEQALQALEGKSGASIYVFRLPNVFGKWCKPNYNSVVATFCHNIARGLPVQVNDPNAAVTLVYIDDLLDRFIDLMNGADAAPDAEGFETVALQYTVTVGELARQITAFRESRDSLVIARVGAGFARALYATYVSYLPVESFAYEVLQYADPRGVFVEVLKTPDCGQFSFFTAHPGITRGGHYHHTKTEKFLVIKGKARFGFRHILTNETHELFTSGDAPRVVETVPGWSHDITNIGEDEMIVMLWANEIFDRAKPDTYDYPV
jgi:UDP-2-acetamido-2,6-beta-L-arabino-hexul-4-ose reductase